MAPDLGPVPVERAQGVVGAAARVDQEVAGEPRAAAISCGNWAVDDRPGLSVSTRTPSRSPWIRRARDQAVRACFDAA